MSERHSGRYSRTSRSRSRSPFRKNFNERPSDRDRVPRRREPSRDRAPKNRVLVTNIPFECRWMELKDIFREKVGEVSFVELFEDNKGKFNGSGVVEFKDAETAKRAVNLMHKFELKGRMLNVKEDVDLDRGRDLRGSSGRGMERDRMRNDMGFGDRGDFRSGPGFDTYGLNPEFIKSLGIQGPLTTKIFISNLDYKVTEKKLEEIFKLAGKVVKMELNLDNEGKSKGHAIGEFEHPLEAVQAISMFHGQRLYTRVMNVRMDRFADDEPASKLPSGLHGIGKGLGVNGLPMQFNKTSGVSNGNFGLGIGGNMSGGGGLGSMGGNPSMSSMGMSSGSMGMSGSMSGDRGMMSNPSMGMGMGTSGMGASSMSMGMGSMGGGSSMMSPTGMGHSMESFGRSYKDSFDRGHDSYNSTVSDTVLLGNLPSNFTWQMLKERFRDIAGDVRFAEMKSQGMAMLRFGSVQEAQRAADLIHNTRFDGRSVQARLY